jgi:hypothetical protein
LRLLLTVLALALNGLGALFMLLIVALGHMVREGNIVALVFVAMSALNILAILFGARFGRPKADVQVTAQTFD